MQRKRPQGPHREHEVYVVLAGRGSIDIEGEPGAGVAGSVFYVPKGMRHRFVHITEDLDVLGVFAPPESP